MGGGPTPLADRLGALTVGSQSLPIGERRAASSSHRVDRRARGARRRRRRLRRLEGRLRRRALRRVGRPCGVEWLVAHHLEFRLRARFDHRAPGRPRHGQRPRRGTLDRMSYGAEAIPGVVVVWTVLLLLLVPEFAVIAVLVLALAALVALVALAAAALVSPYLLVRGLPRRLAPTNDPTENTMDRLAERDPEPLGPLIAGVPRRAQMAVLAPDEPDESRAILGVAQSLRRQTGRREPVPGAAGVHRGRGATEEPHRCGT